MKQKRLLILLLALSLALQIGCAQKQNVHGYVDKTVQVITPSWFAVQDTALVLHDAGILKGEAWEKAKGIQARGSEIVRRVWNLWLAERRIDEGDYAAIITVIAEMQQVINEVKK